jgi:RNA polymerase sigma factor (sigma-70 family)
MSTEQPLSFELLYQDYSRRVYLWAYRLLGSHEAAEDATQEVFLRTWRYLPNYDPEKGTLTSWLYRMTVQVICNQRRSNQGHATLLSLEQMQWDVHNPEAVDPQYRYEGNTEQLALHASGYHEVEIARSVGRTSRTVRTWLMNGRAHLLEALEGAR